MTDTKPERDFITITTKGGYVVLIKAWLNAEEGIALQRFFMKHMKLNANISTEGKTEEEVGQQMLSSMPDISLDVVLDQEELLMNTYVYSVNGNTEERAIFKLPRKDYKEVLAKVKEIDKEGKE